MGDAMAMAITDELSIEESDFDERFVRSGRWSDGDQRKAHPVQAGGKQIVSPLGDGIQITNRFDDIVQHVTALFAGT